MSDNIIKKHYFSDQDKKKNKNDSPISIKEYKAKNSLSYINRDNVLSTNSCSINSTKFLPKVRTNNLIEKDDSIKINKTQNIINIVNNMNGEDKKKINLKMNINKYNIKYYVSENRLEKFLQNIKMKNKTLTNRNTKLSINNFFKEVNRPNSSPGKKIKTKINISNSNIKRGLTIDRKNSEKILLDNISDNSKNKNNNNKIYNFTKYTQLNQDLNYNSSSPRIKKRKTHKKKFSIESDIDIKKINTFRKVNNKKTNIFINKPLKNTQKSKFENNNNLPLSISYKNNINSPLNLRRISVPINKFKFKTIESNSNSFNSNSPKSPISKMYNSIIKSDRTEFNSDYTRNNPLSLIMKNIFLSPNSRKKNNFKRKFKKTNGSGKFYDKLKDKDKNKNDSRSKFTFIFDKEENQNNNKIEENMDELNDKNHENKIFLRKFIIKQVNAIQSKLINIKKNKNLLYSECLTKKINQFYDFISENEKILIKKEVKNNFSGKDKSLKKIYNSFFNRIKNDILIKFIFIVYKLYYKTRRRIIRSFYTISFPFLLDKYLNPRKGMLTLIFVFGIERKSGLIHKPRRRLSKNNIYIMKSIHYFNSTLLSNENKSNIINFNNNKNNINSSRNNKNTTIVTFNFSNYNINNKSNNNKKSDNKNNNNKNNNNSNNLKSISNLKLSNNNSSERDNNFNTNIVKHFNNFNTITIPNLKFSNLNNSNNNINNNNIKRRKITNKFKTINPNQIRRRMQFFPEKTINVEKNRLTKIKDLLNEAYKKEGNILYISEMTQSDTSSKIIKQSLYKNSYEKKRKFVHLFSKSIMKQSQNIYLMKKMNNRKSIKKKSLHLNHLNNIKEINEIDFYSRKSILQSQKILNDNITEKYAIRKKTFHQKKKYFKDFQISNNLFSTTNQEITKLKTQMIKASILKTIENNLYKLIFYYIKEDNLMLVEKYIIDNYGFMNMNYKDENGFTFLNCAVRYNCRKEIVQFLLIKGCNPNIPNVSFFNINFFLEFWKLSFTLCIILSKL